MSDLLEAKTPGYFGNIPVGLLKKYFGFLDKSAGNDLCSGFACIFF